MTTRRLLAAVALLSILAMAGCTRDMVINVDGMPVSNHEYNLTNEETGIRVVFVLAKYYRDYEGDEYILKPAFLDALHANRIESKDVDHLVLHVKVVNLKRQLYTLHWSAKGPGNYLSMGLLYSGKLSRKDFYINLPAQVSGDYTYLFRLEDESKNDLFNLPLMRYKMKGGINKQDQLTTR